MFHITEDGVAYENLPAFMHMQQDNRNVCMGNNFLFVFPAGIPEKKVIAIDEARMG